MIPARVLERALFYVSYPECSRGPLRITNFVPIVSGQKVTSPIQSGKSCPVLSDPCGTLRTNHYKCNRQRYPRHLIPAAGARALACVLSIYAI